MIRNTDAIRVSNRPVSFQTVGRNRNKGALDNVALVSMTLTKNLLAI